MQSFVQGLHESNPQASELEESNALALAIISSGNFKIHKFFLEFFLVIICLINAHYVHSFDFGCNV